MRLNDHARCWEDTEECAKRIVDYFTMCVDRNGYLKAHRDFVEKRGYGFGERAFHWLWKLIVDDQIRLKSIEAPPLRFLEIGVFRGQVVSLLRLLADRVDVPMDIVGIGMLSLRKEIELTGAYKGLAGAADVDDDNQNHIADLHDHFGQAMPMLMAGDSTSPEMHEKATELGPFDIVYIDGCHIYDWVANDLQFYPQLLKPGGLLVVDDASCFLKQPEGYFKGLQDVSTAVLTMLGPDPTLRHLFAVMHNRVWRKL